MGAHTSRHRRPCCAKGYARAGFHCDCGSAQANVNGPAIGNLTALRCTLKCRGRAPV